MKAVSLWVATLRAPCCNAVAASLVCLWWTSGYQTCHQRQGDQMTTFDLTDVFTTYLLFTRLQWQQTDFPLYQALILFTASGALEWPPLLLSILLVTNFMGPHKSSSQIAVHSILAENPDTYLSGQLWLWFKYFSRQSHFLHSNL